MVKNIIILKFSILKFKWMFFYEIKGSFHCDEGKIKISFHASFILIRSFLKVLACFMLRQLPEYESSEIVRSRDPEILNG